jgi:type VI secretion system protein VasG
MKACADPDTAPNAEGLAAMLRPDLPGRSPAARSHGGGAFFLSEKVPKQIIELQLKKIADRMRQNHKAAFEYDETVVNTIARAARK